MAYIPAMPQKTIPSPAFDTAHLKLVPAAAAANLPFLGGVPGHTEGPRRPLMVRFGAMGDMILMTTMIRALSARFDSPVDILSSGSWSKPLLSNQPGVGTIYLLENRKLPYLLSRSQRALVKALKARGAGPTWCCDTDEGRTLKLLRRAGIDESLVCSARHLPVQDNEHLVDYWHRFARRSPAAGDAGTPDRIVNAPPTLVVPAKELERLERWLADRGLGQRQLLLIQSGNKRTMRTRLPRRRPSNIKWWPENRWAAVIQVLARMHPQAAILMLGVPQEHGLNEEIMALAGVGSAVNLARDLPMSRLLALQARASGMISVDTGPAHAAAALGCPVVVLFGREDPMRIAPRGPAEVRCLTGRDEKGASMLGITVDQVLAAWQDLPKR